MAIGEDMVSSDNKDINDNSTSNVSLSTGELTTKVVELMAALANQDKFLRLATCESNDYKNKYEVMLQAIESVSTYVVLSNETDLAC